MVEKARTNPKTAEGPTAGGAVLLTCWDCRTTLEGQPGGDTHFCLQCGKVQPLAGGTDYFHFFGLPRKLGLNAAELEKRFHELSWQLHPDRFHNASDHEQALSLERSAILNDAFRTLRDPVARVEYLLRLEGLRRDGEVRQQAPPDLLEEVFTLNEHLEELRAAKRAGSDPRELAELRHRLEKTREAFQQRLDEVLAELEEQFPHWDEAGDRGALERMSEILNRQNYIRNLVRNVTEELEES